MLYALLQIERERQQGPEAWRALLTRSLHEAAKTPDTPPTGWAWYACESCGKWRLVTDSAAFFMGLTVNDEAKFTCPQNLDRPGGLGCAEPPEWVD